jgi:hypothetical protein
MTARSKMYQRAKSLGFTDPYRTGSTIVFKNYINNHVNVLESTLEPIIVNYISKNNESDNIEDNNMSLQERIKRFLDYPIKILEFNEKWEEVLYNHRYEDNQNKIWYKTYIKELNKVNRNKELNITINDLYDNLDKFVKNYKYMNLITVIRDNVSIHKFLENVINLRYPNESEKERRNLFWKYIKYSKKEGPGVTEESYVQGSDIDSTIQVYDFDNNNMVKLTHTMIPKITYKHKSGAYFPYYHKLKNLDLSRYQIYHQYQNNKSKESCFIYTLRQSGIDEKELIRIKTMLVQKNLNINDLSHISKELNITINLTSYDTKKKERENRTKRYNIINKGYNPINIGLIEGHYFINETTNITKYSIINYSECYNNKHFPSCRLHDTYIKKSPKNFFLSSFDVISLLIENNCVEPITIANVINTTEKLLDYTNLKEIRTCGCSLDCNCGTSQCPKSVKCSNCDKFNIKCKECKSCNYKFNEYKPYWKMTTKQVFKGYFPHNNPNDNYDLIFADFETHQDQELGYHVPFCLNCDKIDNFTKNEIMSFTRHNFYGYNCAIDFLESLERPSVIITHNLSFDFKMLQEHLTNLNNCIETGTKLKTITAKYKGIHLVFKDNYAFLSYPLKDLPEKFGLDSGMKDQYPYTLINKSNFDSFIPLSECLEHVNNPDLFIENVNRLKCISDGFVDIKKYTKYYCSQDVNILRQSYLKFRQQILDISSSNLDINYYISLPQLSDDYFRMRGCYNGCYKFNGIAHDFIRRCVVGGRVMCANNERNHIKGSIQDFDATSLYPSAMNRLNGYLKGLPKVITIFEPSKYDHYFIEIKVTYLKTERKFPLVSIKDYNGIHNFTNHLVGKNIYIDKTTLEDLIKWQGIKYEFIRGYYFNSGFNNKINEVIRDVFDKRVQLKKEGNSLQETYKLIMNSSYGKLCQKPIKRNIIFKNGTIETNMSYLINNFENIVEFITISDNIIKIVTQKSLCNHFAPVHMAVQVLSMSKRIMNEVICLAEDSNNNIYYQDTDSMHIDSDRINLLATLFKEKYNRDLIGEDMGQFHTDFSISQELKEYIIKDQYDYLINKFGSIEKIKIKPKIEATESLFLGKKCYIDRLKVEYNDKVYEDFHIRMKSITTQCIKDVNPNCIETYIKLYNEESITFDLTKYCPLQKTKDLKMINTIKFVRKIEFPKKYGFTYLDYIETN